MRNKTTKVLITAKNTELLRKLEQKVYRTLPQPVQIHKAMRIKSAKDITMRGKIDIFVLGTEMADGVGEDLIALVSELYPECSLIVHLENEDVHYQWQLYDKYDNIIKCTTRKKLFTDEFNKYLHRSYEKMDKVARQRVDFPGVKEVRYEKVDAIYHITPAGGGRLYFNIYDWEKKEFRLESRKTNMTKFMREYNANGDFIRVHASSIVNKHIIKRLDREGRYLVLLVKDKKGEEIQIDIGEAYYKDVLTQLEGLY